MSSFTKNFKQSFFDISSLFGYGFFLAAWKWYDIALFDYFQTDSSSLLFQFLSSAGLFMSAIASRLILSKRKSLLSSNSYVGMVTVSLLVIAIVSVLAYANLWLFAKEIISIMGIVHGFAVGGSVLLWVERFGCVSVSKALAGVAIAYTMCLVILLYLLDLTKLFTGLTVFALPILSHFFLFRSQSKSTPIEGTEPFAPIRPSRIIGLLSWVTLVTFVYKIVRNIGIENSSALEFFQAGSLIPVVLITAFICFFPRRVGFQNMYRISLVLISVGLCMLFFLEQVSMIGEVLVGSGYFVASISMLIVIASYANLSKASAVQGYAYILLANITGNLLALVTPAVLSHAGLSLINEKVSFLMLAIILLLLVPYALRKESDLQAHFSTVDSAVESDEEGVSVAVLCETFGEHYQLSKREISILFLHIEGFSQAGIAEELFIAEGTVRAHYNNIYKKLAVHSKEELSEVIEEYRSDFI